MKAALKQPQDLEGLIPHELGLELQKLASHVPGKDAIVEIGSYRGKSTCYLAAGAASGFGAHVWAVDPWDTPGNVTGRFGFAEPETRLAFDAQVEAAGLKDRITAMQGFSKVVAAAWTGPKIGLLYIDGDHSAKSVTEDFNAWMPHLEPGATVAFDDWGTPRNPGVALVVAALQRAGTIVDLRILAKRLAVAKYNG